LFTLPVLERGRELCVSSVHEKAHSILTLTNQHVQPSRKRESVFVCPHHLKSLGPVRYLFIYFFFPKKSLVSSMHLFNQKYNKTRNMWKEYHNLNEYFKIPVIKAEFSAPLLQYSMSHVPSESILM